MNNTPPEQEPLVDRLRRETERRGFTLFGVAPATDADGFGRFTDWLDRGFAGEMAYLHKYREHRRHPSSVVESVRSVVMLGMEYGGGGMERNLPPPGPPFLGGRGGGRDEPTPPGHPSPGRKGGESLAPPSLLGRGAGGVGSSPTPMERGTWGEVSGRVARYAHGPDYHRVIWDRLNELSAWLMAEVPGGYAHGTCDSAPLLERDFARRAGLGWFGKNTMLIHKRRGSFFFLAGLLTSIELPVSSPHTASHCGTCTACLDACPTNAFPEPGVLDATKCISYLTIELRGAIPLELREPVGSWLFGCDVCQDVCPWNRKSSGGAFPHDPAMESLDPVELLGLDADAYRERFKKTSLFRNRRGGLLRNAAIVLGNVGDERALPTLEKALTDAEEVVREAAAWAIDRIRQRTSNLNDGNG